MTASQLKAARTKAKISIRKLAAWMGISPSYLADLESGRRTSQEQLDRAGRAIVAIGKVKR